MIRQIHHVQIIIPKERESEAKEFYSSVLGLPLTPKAPSLAGRGGFWLQVGGAQVHVGVEDQATLPQSRAHIAYQVDDLEEMRSKLESLGITCKTGVPIPGMKRFEIRAPFGHRVEFLETSHTQATKHTKSLKKTS